jgi:RNA polymerase-binding transcription factor DksA
MTRQIDDVVYYRGKPYSLADLAGSSLVVPEEYRIAHRSTACWRGYVCTYEVADNLLFVTQLNGSRELIPFTGAMLLGDDYIQELWGMITPDAYKYRTVHELLFQDGQLMEEHDRSRQVAEFREMLSACDMQGSSAPTADEVGQWVQRSFSREYEEFVRDYKATEFVSRVRNRKCEGCGCIIDLGRLFQVPDTTRCLSCQIEFETGEKEKGLGSDPG